MTLPYMVHLSPNIDIPMLAQMHSHTISNACAKQLHVDLVSSDCYFKNRSNQAVKSYKDTEKYDGSE